MFNFQEMMIGAMVGLLFAFGLIIAWQHHQITKDRVDYETLLKNHSALQVTNQNWAQTAAVQNKKIEELVEAQQKAASIAARAVADAQKQSKRNAALIVRIEQIQTMPDDCVGAQNVKNLYLKNRP